MIAVLLLVIPLLGGLSLFVFKNGGAVKPVAFFVSLLTLAVSLAGLTFFNQPALLTYNQEWLPFVGSKFNLSLDGLGQLMCLLTAISFPLILLGTSNNYYHNPARFYALMLLSQAGLMGVFLAKDALLFYFFWELALIPAYFLCSQWGGERRIAITFKFFIYTFIGSLLMLVGIIYLYYRAGETFDLNAFYNLKFQVGAGRKDQDVWLFWLFFIAFAIKMPIFPLHTWQPDAYEQSPTAVTMVLSGVMVKMGVFALLRWLLPVMPYSSYEAGDTIALLSVIGMIYASILAIRQDDLKRLIAYSSIAHIGLMCVAIFSLNKTAIDGAIFQMFVHGVNIIGMWLAVDVIEQRYGTRKLSELGGIAKKAPSLTIFLVVIALANVALPLTNAFVGEFMMFTGIFSSPATKNGMIQVSCAGVCIILAAVYTLNMIKKIFFGEETIATANGKDISIEVKMAFSVIVVLILLMGIYPKPVFQLIEGVSQSVLKPVADIIGKKLF
jgi:NADH-quinone oxidoreductase subunit M